MIDPSVKVMMHTMTKKEKVQQAVKNNLQKLGVKPRLKISATKAEKETKEKSTKVFNVSLSQQPEDSVKLSTGAIVNVPTFLRQAIQFLDLHLCTEGLFRKGGSNARQRELVARLDKGVEIGDKNQPIDVANCLKKYFRDLPEPLIPHRYHELFVRCGMLKDQKIDAILQSCLLLPPHNLSTLAFFMDFLKKVSLHEQFNKMGIENLSKVIGPNIMPVNETSMTAVQARLEAHLIIVKHLIENSKRIGVVPKFILESILPKTNGMENELPRSGSLISLKQQKKNKHRSGSLTRMFNGIKKMVGKNGSLQEIPSIANRNSFEPDITHMSPIKSSKKRKNVEPVVQQQIILKKKRDSFDGNGNSKIRLTSPVSNNPNPTQQRVQPHKLDKLNKKLGLNLDRFVPKNRQKMDIDEIDRPLNPVIERRWSIASGIKNPKKRNFKKISTSSLLDSKFRSQNDEPPAKVIHEDYSRMFDDAEVNLSVDNSDLRSQELTINNGYRLRRRSSQMDYSEKSKNKKNPQDEYVCVPKREYEEIKNRVSEIESQINQELRSYDTGCTDSASEVQNEYERTLDEASIQSTTPADQLARRLSRQLKIRRSIEQRVIRSPSARKIGTIRRRSQEKPLSSRRRLSRANSWHISDKSQQPLEAKNVPLIHCNKVNSNCSSETNERLNDLHKQLCTLISHTAEHTRSSISYREISVNGKTELFQSPRNVILTKHIRRASSFHGNEVTENRAVSFNNQMKNLRKTNSHRNIPDDNQQMDVDMLEVVNEQDNITWKNASTYFGSAKKNASPMVIDKKCSPVLSQTGRASIAKLRTQNAGMVLAKAKLFDDTKLHNKSQEILDRQTKVNSQSVSRDQKVSTPPNTSNTSRRKKSKSPKNIEVRLKSMQANVHYQTPTIDQENSRKENKTMTLTNELTLCRRDSANFNKTPHIKKPLTMKTPKSAKSLVRRAPVDTKRTPLKAVPLLFSGTPNRLSPRIALKSRQITRNIN